MTPQSSLRRIGWLAALAACTALYLMLHLKVHAVRSEVVRAERQIVALEQEKLLLETEFETRASGTPLRSVISPRGGKSAAAIERWPCAGSTTPR